MKSFLINMKNKIRQATKGFSLVELIVVIAIMAVMAAVLVPALLGYVEKSRARKDDSAMSEVTNAIQLSLADMDIYDEALQFAVKDNYSCYCDGDTSTNTDANKILTKEPDLWLFNDNARLLDETVYKPAGKMRGVTVTLKPNGKAEYILKDGIVNQIGDNSTKKGTNAGKVLNDCPELYNRLRSTVGDTIKVSSQTYRNSDYTIFISMGTTGGNQADKQDAIQVYGQYNGTNLPEVAPGVPDAGQNGAPSEQPGGPSESVDSGPNVEQLQEKHQFKYYSTFNGAVADVNSNTIGVNADCDKADATAGIYTDNGETYVVLLKDTTETNRVTVSTSMTINLGGNVLTFDNTNVGIDTVANNGNTITIDGRLEGSKIYSFGQGKNARCTQCKTGNTINVNGGTYVSESDSGKAFGIYFSESSTGILENCTVSATSQTNTTYGISLGKLTNSTIKNCKVSATSISGEAYGVAINPLSSTTMINCNVGVYENSDSQGIVNYGTLTLNNCNITGIRCGIQSNGTLYVDGGTYKSQGHGGIYFCGTNTTSYVKNATIINTGTSSNKGAFYIGGSSGKHNITVNMDNCDIYGEIVLRGTSSEQNNSLYISNSKINLDTNNYIRIDNDTHRLYIGKNCNFNTFNCFLMLSVTPFDLSTAVFETNEIYCQ